MIITESVLIKMNGRHISRYRELGYICKVGEIIEINIRDIARNSSVKILVSCEVCKDNKSICNETYYNSFDNGGYYSCSKCKGDKSRKTNMKKYGVESYTQTEEYLEKSKKTNMKKYGVENVFQSEKIKDKIKETNLEKYGFEYNSQREDIKEKTKETNLIRYGFESHLQSDLIKDKIKETNLLKYGYENVFQSENIKNKIKETNLIKYGTEYASKNEDVKDKIKETNLLKYGYENAAQSDVVKSKIKTSRVENKSWISDEDRGHFENYENSIENKTKMIKSELFEKWNGYDYYDGEYIKDNLNLNHLNVNFPTIDYKISIYSGFKNNIPFYEIASIENICITKRGINSKKNRLTEEEFYKKYKM